MEIKPDPQIRYLYDPQEPAGQLFGQADEDFWNNPVAPIPAVYWQPLPISWQQDEMFLAPAPGGGSGDGSSNAAYILGSANPLVRYNYDPYELPTTVQQFFPEEDFWQNPVAPDNPEPTILWFSEDVAVNPQFDEDFWQNPVSPVADIRYQQQPWVFIQDDFQAPLIFKGIGDEDFWANPTQPIPASLIYPQQSSFDPSEPGVFAGQYEDDSWITKPFPVPLSFYQLLPIQFDSQEVTIQPLQPDEDLWQNWVGPVPASMYMSFPYNPDPEVTMVVVPAAGAQNYIAAFGAHNYVSQRIGEGVEF